MRVHDARMIPIRTPMLSLDKYRWRNGYYMARGLVWFGGSGGEAIEPGERGERVTLTASALICKDITLHVGYGACMDVDGESSCDYRITRLTDRGGFYRVELSGIPLEYRG